MSKIQDLYTGSAGQTSVMSEFLIRGYNVAVPEVDRGDDLFVVHDASGNFDRIQVKTARAKRLRNGGYSTQYLIPLTQLATPQTPELHYVFVVRHQDRWTDHIVLPRDALYDEHIAQMVGTVIRDSHVRLYFSFQSDDVVCSRRSFQRFRNDFDRWPALAH